MSLIINLAFIFKVGSPHSIITPPFSNKIGQFSRLFMEHTALIINVKQLSVSFLFDINWQSPKMYLRRMTLYVHRIEVSPTKGVLFM